jgi:hypothetical protein
MLKHFDTSREEREVSCLRPHRLLESLPGGPEGPAPAGAGSGPSQQGHPRILPDGTVLAGLRWVLAAKEAGRKKVRVVVRGDPADLDQASIGLYVVALHVHDFRLDWLDLGGCFRAWVRWKKTLRSTPHGRALAAKHNELIRQLFDISRRELERCACVLDAPLTIQDSFRSGNLPLTTAIRILGRPGYGQRAIAAAIEQGACPSAASARYLPKKDRRHKKAYKAVEAGVRGLERFIEDLEGRIDQVGALPLKWVDVLECGLDMITRLLLKKRQPPEAEQLQEWLRDLRDLGMKDIDG